MITVAIVEDDEYIRSSIAEFLQMQPDFILLGEFGSVEAFIATGLGPDALLLDIELPGVSGLEGAFRIKEEHPNTNILMLTVYEDRERIFKALQAGATGYLLKNTPLIRLRAAILEATEGGAPMSPLVAKKVVEYFSAKTAPVHENTNEQLTVREHEVAKLLITGDTYKQIAWRLNISPDTVRQHIKNIYRKLQINSRVQLINEFR